LRLLPNMIAKMIADHKFIYLVWGNIRIRRLVFLV